MDTRVIILLVASVLLAVSLVYFISSAARTGRVRQVTSAPPPCAPDYSQSAETVSRTLAGPIDLGGWVPPSSRRDYPPRAEIPSDELEARLAELTSAFEAVVDAVSPPAPGSAAAATSGREPEPATEPEVKPAPAQAPVPAPAPAPREPAPGSAAAATSGREPEPATEPEVKPVPAPAQAPVPAPAPAPREPAPAQAPVPAPTPSPRPTAEPALAQAPARAPQVRPAALEHDTARPGTRPAARTVVRAEVPQAPRQTPRARAAAPAVRDYTMVSPVEITLADGGARVGVRAGTPAFLEYQRLAAVLLGDLKRSGRR